MKYFLLITLLFLVSCSTAQKAPVKTSEYCVLIDEKINFYRCETPEVVCYGISCFPKPAKPQPTPSPTPISKAK